MNKTIVVFLAVIFLLPCVPAAEAQTPSLRLLTMEGMRNTEIVLSYDENEQPIYTPCLELNFTFAFTGVEADAERCIYTLWRGTSVMGNWSIGFSLTGGLQGIYGGETFLTFYTVMAEFPYSTETIDGRVFKLYRIHVYIDEGVSRGDTLYFGGNYKVPPTLQGSSLERLKVSKVTSDGVAVFKDKVLHDA